MHAMYSLVDPGADRNHHSFLGLGAGAYLISKRLKADYERLAITAARTSIFLVNFGFWIGSLWGDRLMLWRRMGSAGPSPTAGRRARRS